MSNDKIFIGTGGGFRGRPRTKNFFFLIGLYPCNFNFRSRIDWKDTQKDTQKLKKFNK